MMERPQLGRVNSAPQLGLEPRYSVSLLEVSDIEQTQSETSDSCIPITDKRVLLKMNRMSEPIMLKNNGNMVWNMENEIKILKKKLHERGSKINEQEREIHEQESKIEEQRNKIHEQKGKINELKSKIHELEISRMPFSKRVSAMPNVWDSVHSSRISFLSNDIVPFSKRISPRPNVWDSVHSSRISFRSNDIEFTSPINNRFHQDCIEFEDDFVELPDLSDWEWIRTNTEEGCVVDDKHMKKLEGSELNNCIGELVMDFGKICYGTATLVWYGLDSPTFFLLTCAHNILRTTKLGQYIWPSKVTFYRGRSGSECISKHKVTVGFIHPRYKDLHKDLGEDTIYEGVDIAICFFKESSDKDFGKLKNNMEIDDLLQLEKRWHSSSKGDEITVTGYPGKSGHFQYSMDGNIDEIQNSKHESKNSTSPTKVGKILTYNNLNTTCGQSGSPVIYKSKIVGIHVGYNELECVNVSTFVTLDIQEWIQDKIKAWRQKQKKPAVDDYLDEKELESKLNQSEKSTVQVSCAKNPPVRGGSASCCTYL